MRPGRLSSALALLAFVYATNASAQASPKKKPPKRADDATETRAPTVHDSAPDPAPLDTDLRESDDAAPTTNPWVTSGIAKKKGVVAPTAKPDPDSPSTPERAASRTGSSDWGTTLDDKPAEKRTEKKDGEWTSRPFAVSGTGGYATENLRMGFGIRAGYSILDQFYIGAAFTYHLGTTFGGTTIGGYYPAGEVGYDYHVQGFTIRPYTGLGYFVLAVSGTQVEIQNANALAVYPGLQGDYQIGPGFVGVDMRVLFILQTGSSASIGFFGVGGLRF